MTVLEIEGLDAGYGDLQILSNVDITVDDGEYVTIVGPNGAGKSTAMKSVLGLTTYMDGSITLNGESVKRLDTNAIIERGISYVPQSDNLFPSMTVRENLLMGAFSLPEVSEDRLEKIFDRFPILKERQRQRAGTMSGGQQQMLAIAQGLVAEPDLLMLDEPTLGLAPQIVDDVWQTIQDISEEGVTIILVDEKVELAQEIADSMYLMREETLTYLGERGEFREAYEEVTSNLMG